MADYLSRHPCDPAPIVTKIEREINLIVESVRPVAMSVYQVEQAMVGDLEMEQLVLALGNKDTRKWNGISKNWWLVRNELTLTQNGVVLRGKLW